MVQYITENKALYSDIKLVFKENTSVSELELIKVILHRILKFEKEMLKRKDYMTLVDSFMAHEDQINKIINTLEDLKTTVEITHIENINSDEILLRSIRQTQND